MAVCKDIRIREEGNMKIIITSNVKVAGVFEPPVELDFDAEDITIAEALMRLSETCGSIEFLRKDGALGNDIQELFVNGKSVFGIEKGIQSKLADGDGVFLLLSLQLLGGG